MRAVAGHLINTPLQWGARGTVRALNRFNGLFGAGETVETVIELFPAVSTPLKWGVNESTPLVLIRRDAPGPATARGKSCRTVLGLLMGEAHARLDLSLEGNRITR